MKRRIASYAKHTQETFNERPLSAGDALVFSSVSYVQFFADEDAFPFKTADSLDKTFGNSVLLGCASSRRYRDVKILYQKTVFLQKPHCQFSVTVFEFDEKKLFIAFKGTDETVIGWLEDFDIIHEKRLLSHDLGIEVLNDFARRYPEHTLFVGGHSKGGHVATYAAAFCDDEIKNRIEKVYCFDGPGFLPEIRYSPEYKEVLKKTEKYVPAPSFIGMILTGSDPITPASSFGFWMQKHDHFSWYIQDNGEMVVLKKLRPIALKTKKVFQKIISVLSWDERKMFADIAERTLVYAEIDNIYAMRPRSIHRIFHYLLLCVTDPAEKKFLKWLRREFVIGFLSPFCK